MRTRLVTMRTRMVILTLLIADLLLLNAAIFLESTYFDRRIIHFIFSKEVFLILNIGWFITYLLFIEDLRYMRARIKRISRSLVKKFTVFIALVSVTIIYLGIADFRIHIIFFSTAVFFFMQIGLLLWIFFFFVPKYRADLSLTAIIGDNHVGHQLYKYLLNNTYLGLDPVGVIGTKHGLRNSDVIGSISEFQNLFDDIRFHNVIIAVPLYEDLIIKDIMHICEKNAIKLNIVPNYFGQIDRAFKVDTLGNIPLLNIRTIPLEYYPNRFWKRAFDIVVSSILIVITSPLMLLVAVLIAIDSGMPVLYYPIRQGVYGRTFMMFKFRSMKYEKSSFTDLGSTKKNDPRVTPVGRFLRKYNLDELPQLFNVLKNEMSMVGPRPHRENLNKKLQQKINNYMVRHVIKPGITGWAQVNGWRGPTEYRLQYMGRILHDLWYLEHWTFGLDLYIIFLTIFGKKSKENAF